MSDHNFFDNLPGDMDISLSNNKQAEPIIRENSVEQSSIVQSTPLGDQSVNAATSATSTATLEPLRQALQEPAFDHNSFEEENIQKALHIPQISLQAFFETPATAKLLQLSAADRRMSRSHITMQAGGIVAAINFYQSAPTPNLIVIESRLAYSDLLAKLDELAAVCDSGTKVFIMGHENDIRLYRGLVSKGVSDYMVLPTSPINFIESVYNIYHDPESAPLGKKIAFFGAKGGVGSSSIAHNLGYTIAYNIQDSVTVADLDFAFGTLGLNFNQDPMQDIADLLSTPERIDEGTIDKMLLKHGGHLNLLANSGNMEKGNNISVDAITQLLSCMSQTVSNSIVDLPHVWNEWVKTCMVQADQIVITATPDLACLRNTKNLVDYLKANRNHDVDPIIIMNQVGMTKKPEIKSKDFADTVGVMISAEINYDPRLFGTAANNGQMIQEFTKSDRILEQFNDLAQIIVGKKLQQSTGKSSLMDMFKRKKQAKG